MCDLEKGFDELPDVKQSPEKGSAKLAGYMPWEDDCALRLFKYALTLHGMLIATGLVTKKEKLSSEQVLERARKYLEEKGL